MHERTYSIPSSSYRATLETLKVLAKKGYAFEAAWGPLRTEKEGRRIVFHGRDLTITTPALPFAFVAKVEPMPKGGALVSEAPASPVGVARRYLALTSAGCEHCRKDRARSVSYVVVNTGTGEQTLVGSSCLAAFTGIPSAVKLGVLAWAWTGLEAAERSENQGTRGQDSLSYVAEWCALSIRLDGFHSAKASDYPTAQRAFKLESSRVKDSPKPEEQDETTAEKAIAWAAALSDEACRASDYLNKLRVMALNDASSSWGMVAALVLSYLKEAGELVAKAAQGDKAPSTYIGTLKGRFSFDSLTLTFVHYLDGDYGTTTIAKFETPEGQVLVWRASGAVFELGDVGKVYQGTARVEEHSPYKGQLQTRVSRAKLEVKA